MTQTNPPPPSPRKTRLAVAVFFFISGFTFATWASRIPGIQRQLHLNNAQLGAVLFALPAGLMCMLPVTGFLLSRFSSRRTLLTGALLFNGMICLLGYAAWTWQLVMILFCFGMARNLFNISANAQSIETQSLYDRPIIATFHGIWSVAGFAGAALGSLMVTLQVSPAAHFTGVGLVLSALAFYFFPGTISRPPGAHERKRGIALPNRHMLKFGLICFASMACEGTMYDWSGIYFEKALQVSKETATAGFVMYMIAMTTGRFTGDRLAGRFGTKTLLQYSGGLIFSGMLLASLLPYLVTTGIAFVMVGFGVSCVVPMVFSMVGKSNKMSSGPAIAAVSTVGYMGFLIVPPVVGFIAQVSSLRWSFAFMAAFGLLVTVIITRAGKAVA